MLQQTVQMHFRRAKNFMGFARAFIMRKNPLKAMADNIVELLKSVLSIKQKQKLAHYRLNYQLHKLKQLENMIYENNEHNFLRGSKFNEMR